ncbi:PQQ-binding-like beta-propeller repeat protein [Modestobacter sp. I12A-02662]|uniref:outer membrane protein assembly factor BamB family protein n=1 Tax=Modestobacter sp. I12A-02662 TaxID=1730496 RepID=UPI0034DF7EA3
MKDLPSPRPSLRSGRAPEGRPFQRVTRLRRPPLRIWVWTAVTLVVAAVAVVLWRTSDVVATSTTTAAAPTVPDAAPADELAPAWTASTTDGPRRVVEGGRVLVTDEHGVAMLDAGTGTEAWHYRRSNATLCDATAVDGVVIAVFRTTGRCNEAVALTATTGERDWYRNVRFRTDVDLASTTQILLAASPTGIVTIDPTGNNTRWRYAPATGCRFVGADVGSSGVVVLQRCEGSTPLQVQLLDGFGGTVIWTRDLDTEGRTARLAGVGRLVDVVVGDTVHVIDPDDGTLREPLPLPALAAGDDVRSEPLQQAEVGDVTLLWARGTAWALDQETGRPRWSVPATGLPALGEDDTVVVPEDGALVRRSVADGSERDRSAAAGTLPAGGRTALLGPVVVYATSDQVLGLR